MIIFNPNTKPCIESLSSQLLELYGAQAPTLAQHDLAKRAPSSIHDEDDDVALASRLNAATRGAQLHEQARLLLASQSSRPAAESQTISLVSDED